MEKIVCIFRIIFCALVASTVLFVGSMAMAASSDPMRVAFISPSLRYEYKFWDNYIAFMEVAARNLGIELTVFEAQNRYEQVDLARQVLAVRPLPDYLITAYLAHGTQQVLQMANDAGVKVLLTNTDVVASERVEVGWPRSRYPCWIGHLFPDDLIAGHDLTNRLIRKGRELGLDDFDGTLHVVAFGGNRDATSGNYRKQGLDMALRESVKVKLDRYVSAQWLREIAREKGEQLLRLHPEARVLWAANDAMVVGLLDAIRALGLTPGQDVITGGIDWMKDVLDEVARGAVVGTLGGHFMEGAWALVLLYDYHHGNDFAVSGLTRHSTMRMINRENIDRYMPVLDPENWLKIDFHQFTKTDNPSFKDYDFSPDAAVRALQR